MAEDSPKDTAREPVEHCPVCGYPRDHSPEWHHSMRKVDEVETFYREKQLKYGKPAK